MKTSVLKYYYFFILGLSASVFGQNYSLSFDGNRDYVDLPENISFPSSPGFSVSMWVKSPWTDNRRLFMGINNGNGTPNTHSQRYALTCNNNNSAIKFFTEGGDLGPQHTFVNYEPSFSDLANEWIMLTATADFNSYRLYIDGALVAEETNIPTNDFILNSSGDARLGADVYGTSSIDDYTGLMDEVSIWNRALTGEEVAGLVYGLQGDESGLVAYWDFNEGEGNTLNDLSENGYHGTITDATWNDDVPPLLIPPVPPVPGGNNSLSFDGTND